MTTPKTRTPEEIAAELEGRDDIRAVQDKVAAEHHLGFDDFIAAQEARKQIAAERAKKEQN